MNIGSLEGKWVWVYVVTAIKGSVRGSKKAGVEVGTQLIYRTDQGFTHMETIFNWKKGKFVYAWCMKRVRRAKVKDGKLPQSRKTKET